MTDLPADQPRQRRQQYFDNDQFHGASRAADASRSDTVYMSPRIQPVPSTDHRPLEGQPWGHAGVFHDNMFPSTYVAGNRQVNGDWVHPPTATENPASTAQAQLHDLQGHDHIVPDYARNVPVEAHHVAPAPVIDAFNDDIQQAIGGDPAPAFLDEVPHQGPVPNGRASEVLRQLALLYLNDPNSQIVMIRMGPGHDDDVTVDFTLRLTNL